MRTFAAILLLLVPSCVCAQQFRPSLTDRHVQKIERLKDPAKKLRKYRAYLRRDSTAMARRLDRMWQAKTDSLSRAYAARHEALERKANAVSDGVHTKIYRTIYQPWARKLAKEQLRSLDRSRIAVSPALESFLKACLEEHFLAATQSDSLLMALRTRMPAVNIPRSLRTKLEDFASIEPEKAEKIRKLASMKMPMTGSVQSLRTAARRYSKLAEQLDTYSRMSIDTARNLAMAAGERIAIDYISRSPMFAGIGELQKNQAEMNAFRQQLAAHEASLSNPADSVDLKPEAKRKAEELAKQYLQENPGLLGQARRKMAVLMKKYAVVPNSNDLTTAIKRSSQKEKSFKERLVLAGNFQILSLEPVSVDFSPSLGYKFNRMFSIGTGLNYRQTFSPTATMPASADMIGYKAFAAHDAFRTFFGYAEFDRNSPNTGPLENINHRTWRNAAFVGIGRKISIHAKLEMTVLAMYNLIHREGDEIYPRRFVVKIGLQTSELAMFKRK